MLHGVWGELEKKMDTLLKTSTGIIIIIIIIYACQLGTSIETSLQLSLGSEMYNQSTVPAWIVRSDDGSSSFCFASIPSIAMPR